jgi:hypothetical protein
MPWPIGYISNAGESRCFFALPHYLIIYSNTPSLGSGVKEGLNKVVDLDGMEDVS